MSEPEMPEESQDPTPGEDPAGPVQRPGRRRQRATPRSRLVGAVLVGLLGFAVVTQVRARDDDDQYAGLRSADLIQVLNGLNAQSRRADAEISDLEKTRSQLRNSSQRREAAASRAREEASTLGILAGTLAATGPGVRITIDDPDHKVSLNNLLDGIEELRAAGAEAMEVNDKVRVVAQTSFEQAGDDLIVDGQRLSEPYVIDAIGNPSTLAPVLDFAGGFGYDIDQAGGRATVTKLDTVDVRSVVTPSSDRYAKAQG